jgi:hypothetical protein
MRHETPTWLDGIGALLVAILCTVAIGLPGFLAGIVFLLLWYTTPPLYTVAFGQLVVGALSDGIAVNYLALMEIGLLAVLVGPSLTLDRPRWRVIITSGVAIGFGATALAIVRWSDRLWLAVGFVLLVFASVSYGLHRYEHVALGLVEETTHE